MKKTITLLCMFVSLTFIHAQKKFTGVWLGKLTAGSSSLRVVFHFEQQTNGSYTCSMDSPDQGLTDIFCDSVAQKGDSVIVKVNDINGSLNGLIINDSTINGNWKQGDMKLPLVLNRTMAGKEKVAEQNRDSNCIETKIILETKTGKIFGTLCVPKGFVKGPVALIIAGSGPTDRNCNSPAGLKTDAFKILAHKLAGQNIATVRYDKRGVAQSHAAMVSESDIRFDNYIDDATDWIKMLKSDKRFSGVIIIGHSEGSLVGMIAAKNGADKYVSIAGAGESVDKTLKKQFSNLPPEYRDSADAIIDSLVGGKPVTRVPRKLYAMFRPSVQPYMISLFKYNPQVEIKKLTIPVLIIQGTNDIQLTVDDAKNLSAANKKAKLILLQNMNHIFRVVEGDRQANQATYNMPELPIDPELVTDISEFINKH